MYFCKFEKRSIYINLDIWFKEVTSLLYNENKSYSIDLIGILYLKSAIYWIKFWVDSELFEDNADNFVRMVKFFNFYYIVNGYLCFLIWVYNAIRWFK